MSDRTTKITSRTVTGAKPEEKRYTIFDSVIPGFGLRVYPSGSMTWIFEYRPGEGGRGVSKKRLTIGKTGDFTPEMARRIADGHRAAVMTGGDPSGAKQAERDAPTVREVATAFLEQHVAKKRGAATLASYRDTLALHVLPKHGSRKAKAFTGRELSNQHQQMADTPYAANKMLAVVSSMYGWANGPAAILNNVPNPAEGIERFEETERGRVLSTDELQRLGAAIRLAETDGIAWQLNDDAKAKHRRKEPADRVTVIGEHAAAALRLLIFTGSRLREILKLRWDQFDAERGLLMVPTHKSSRKTGAKVIVLNAPSLAILSELPRIGAYIIAGESAGTKDEKPRSDLKRPWEAVRREAGLEDLRIHDLRHNYGGFGAGGGYGLPIIGSLLGHSAKNPRTTARYSHLATDPLRHATNAIGSEIASRMGEPPAAGGAQVLPFKDARKG